jgi:hypothetical protein
MFSHNTKKGTFWCHFEQGFLLVEIGWGMKLSNARSCFLAHFSAHR